MATNNSSDYSPTQYNVQTGGASGTLNNVAPSSTSGFPLISQGSSSQPIFGTAVVGGGGTGNTTFTAYSVICAGTTATGAFQNVSGLGSSAQVLTSNGAGALPTWQAASGTFAPNSTINLFDDFFGQNTTPGAFSLGWSQSVGSFGSTSNLSSSANQGVVGSSALGSGTVLCMYLPSVSGIINQIILGAGALTVNWVIKLATLSNGTNTYTFRCGLGDTTSISDQANGVYFEYSNGTNSGNWVGKTASGSTRSSANSAIAAINSAYVNLQITVNAAASSVAFYINGTQIANSPLATNIPTTSITPFVTVAPSAGTIAAGSVLVDLFYLTQTLTTPR